MANYFENTPKYTIWTPKMALKTAFWGFVIPYALYQVMRPVYVRSSSQRKIALQAAYKFEKS